MPYKCSEELNLSEELDNFEDIVSSSKVHVDYEIRERGIDTYLVEFDFTVDLVMQCAITLADVAYQINGSAEEIFTTDSELEEAFMIDGQTLDTKEAVLTNILINKPMTVVSEGVSFESDEEPEEEINEEPINPAFAKLKDFL